MGNTIFADPFGALLTGIRAGREDNLNESRLAADIQAEQNRIRSQELDRALRVELARSEQEFNAAAQAAEFVQRRALQADQNQFTLGLEASRELIALQRERRQNDFTLQRDAAQTAQTIQVEGVRNQFDVGRLGMVQAFTAQQNAANRESQAELQGQRLDAQAALQSDQQGFTRGENTAARDQAALLNQRSNDLRVRLAEIAQQSQTASNELRIRLAEEDAQLRRDLAVTDADLRRELATHGTPRLIRWRPPLSSARKQSSGGAARPVLGADGSIRRGADGLPLLEITPTSTSVPMGGTPATNADGTVPMGGGAAAIPPTAAFPAPAGAPPAVSALGAGSLARGPVATNGLDIASDPAVVASVETRLRSGQPIPNVPECAGRNRAYCGPDSERPPHAPPAAGCAGMVAE